MRNGFREAIRGWLLVDDFNAVSAYLEAAAKYVEENGGLDAMTANEKKTVDMMIERQLILAENEGLGPFSVPTPFRKSPG